jgi:hypothetical protein
LLVAEVGDELEGAAERGDVGDIGDVAVQDVLSRDVAAFDLGDPGWMSLEVALPAVSIALRG